MTQQLLTPYQSQYYAWLLTRRAASDTVESLASILVNSQVDFNPHQVDAALFARKNPAAADRDRDEELGFCWFRSLRAAVESKTGELT